MPAAAFAAADAASAPALACSVQAQSPVIVLMVCPSGFDADTISAAASAACGQRRACNVWVWDSATKAPKVAPRHDSEIDKAHTTAAIAVWANDSRSLLRLQRAGAGR